MRTISGSVISLAFAALAVANAAGEVRWLETKYDFGLMKEAAGPKTGQARFVNTGTEAVNVLDAKPSCGCTGATYPQDPVMPGDTAVITFTYDPAGRPGRFDKTIKVRFDNGRREVIRIVGNVLGTPESLAQFYPVEAGSLRLSDSRLIAGTVTMGKSPSLFVNAYNTLNDSVRVKAHTDAKGVKLKLSENAAGPGDIVTLAVYFDTRAWGKPGPFDVPVTLGAEGEPGTEIRLVGEVVPVRRAAGSKELEKAPVCVAAPPTIDLGIIGTAPVQCECVLLNEGKSVLNVGNVWAASPALKIKSYPEKLKPGKSGKLQMELDPAQLRGGAFRQEVKVATDDPVNPLLSVWVSGEIQ